MSHHATALAPACHATCRTPFIPVPLNPISLMAIGWCGSTEPERAALLLTAVAAPAADVEIESVVVEFNSQEVATEFEFYAEMI